MAELLSPAGTPEKMAAAFRFGADAVYLAGPAFGMRAAAGNFTEDEICAAVREAGKNGKKIYITVNTQPRDEEYPALLSYLRTLRACPPDGLIVADLGVLATVRKILPDTEIHISTQANILSAATAEAYAALGAGRVVLSRELSLKEIKKLRERLSREVELEAFVHGAMCVSYSGRCLLSNYLSGRDACRGACTQPCRWHYRVRNISAELEEEKRPGQILPVYEEGGEAFFMSSRDLCMIEYIPQLLDAGITSFKIEGRMKSAYYTAVLSNAYRMAIDAAESGKPYDPAWRREAESVSHRPYDTGYYFSSPHEDAKIYKDDGYLREKTYLAEVLSYNEITGEALFLQHNKVTPGMQAELLTPGKCGQRFTVGALFSEEGERMECVNRPKTRFRCHLPFPAAAGDLLRGAE